MRSSAHGDSRFDSGSALAERQYNIRRNKMEQSLESLKEDEIYRLGMEHARDQDSKIMVLLCIGTGVVGYVVGI